MLKEEQRFAASDILEGMTSISALLNSNGVNDRKIEKVLIDRTKRKSKSAQIGFLTAKSHELGFPVEFVDSAEIDVLAVGNTHGGILALCTPRTIPTLSAEDIQPNQFYVYLEGIEDPYNFGYTVRSLYAAGADRYLLRHETATECHYEKLHPAPLKLSERKECLFNLKEIGFQTGCGFMVDSPYQTTEHLAKDLKFIEEFSPEMCGIGPFIPHKDTPFREIKAGSVDLTLYLLSLIRLIKPNILLPATPTGHAAIH